MFVQGDADVEVIDRTMSDLISRIREIPASC